MSPKIVSSSRISQNPQGERFVHHVDPANAEQSVMSGQAWRDFCSRLMDAGEAILQSPAPTTLLERTEGFRYLTRLLRVGLIQTLEAADADFPFFYRPSDEITKYGGDNPDNVYWTAMVRGTNEYRITGRRGSMFYWSIGSKVFRMDKDGSILSTGELSGDDLDVEPDGKFEIIVSGKPQPVNNWLPMKEETNFLLMRQTYLDFENEVPGSYKIERIGAAGCPAPLDPATLVTALMRATAFVRGNALRFQEFIAPVLPSVNTMPPIDQSHMFKAGGDPAIRYRFGHYMIRPDEAWVIRVVPPRCQFWNFSVYNHWLESVDYRHHRVSLNNHSAKRNEDGSVTVVVAARDPKVGNWIDTAGHFDAIGLFRWVGAESEPDPQCDVVKLLDLEMQARA
jgi:hypothetical protein